MIPRLELRGRVLDPKTRMFLIQSICLFGHIIRLLVTFYQHFSEWLMVL